MTEEGDRKELERRLNQALRMAAGISEPLASERLKRLIRELEEQLR